MKRIFTILTLTIFCLCVFAESVTPDKLLKATINGIEWTYVVLDETKKTCKIGGLNTEGPVQAIAPSVTGVVNVPDVIDGYTVVEIYEEAFYNTNATSIIVPNTVTTIDEDAFKSPYLVTVELPASIVSVDKDAFEKCVALTDVTIHATTPPNVRKRLFPLGDSSETPSKAKLHVPEGCKAAYAAATGWADFSLCGGIFEDAATAISTAKSVVNDNTESYTLDGRRTIGEKGINIIRMSDGTTRKVLKK